MSTLKKGMRVVQASSFEDWHRAPRPNYQRNTDLKFPYSEYPRNYQYEFYSVCLPRQDSSTILDFWGEGRIVSDGLVTGFPQAYNVNHQFQLVSTGDDKGKKIPNRIPTLDYDTVDVGKYVPDGSFDRITVMGTPLVEATAAEIARIISGEKHSMVVTYGYKEDDITVLKSKLEAKEMCLLVQYSLPYPLNEITLKPALVFRPTTAVAKQAEDYFFANEMSLCADALCSLSRRFEQISARKAVKRFFETVQNSYLIFDLGYELNKTSDGKNVMSSYMNTNVVKIVKGNYSNIKFRTNYGEPAFLCPNRRVSSGDYEWAFFGTWKYIEYDEDGRYRGGDKLSLVVSSNTEFQIRSNFGAQSFLCVNHPVPAGQSEWQKAFFGTPSYLNQYTYRAGQYFRLHPISGGERFKVESRFGNVSYLCADGKVAYNDYKWAFFGTKEYIDSGYTGGEYLTLIFE